jgi:hypothetical protein
MNEQKFEEIPKITLKTAKIETIVRKNIYSMSKKEL